MEAGKYYPIDDFLCKFYVYVNDEREASTPTEIPDEYFLTCVHIVSGTRSKSDSIIRNLGGSSVGPRKKREFGKIFPNLDES
eukprot:6212264-Pleurochrysis_carterae.AAC.1